MALSVMCVQSVSLFLLCCRTDQLLCRCESRLVLGGLFRVCFRVGEFLRLQELFFFSMSLGVPFNFKFQFVNNAALFGVKPNYQGKRRRSTAGA